MKRTELKRKTPMNRVSKKKLAQGSPRWNGAMGPSVKPRRLRRVSKKNSRPREDMDFRTEYRNRDENEADEILSLFPAGEAPFPFGKMQFKAIPLDENDNTLNVLARQDANQIHHIFGPQRWDKLWNIIHLGVDTHRFCERFTTDGAVLCVTAKLRKGEFDIAEAREHLGYDPIGWLSTKRPVFEFVVPLWAALVKGVE